MGRGANGSPSVLEVVLQQWPSLIFLPTVVVLVAALVGVTAWWDRRDEARVTAKTARATWRPRWGRQAVCTCSWHTMGHTMGTEVGAEGS